jgi:cytoskeletal protein RodZ
MRKFAALAVVLVLLGTVGAAGCTTPTTETSTQLPLNSSSATATTNAATTANTATQSNMTASSSTLTSTATSSATPTATPETTATPIPVTRIQPVLTWYQLDGASIFSDPNPTISKAAIGQSSYSMSVNVEPCSACLWLRWYLDGYELPSQSYCPQGTVASTTTFYVSGMSEGYHTIVVVFKGDSEYESASLGGTFLVAS